MIEFDEHKQVGVDYGKHQKALEWHNFRKERPYALALKWLNLKSSDVLIDIGCGSGLHLRDALQRCHFVHGLDVSNAMLQIAQETLVGFSNFSLHHAGFLGIKKCLLIPPPTCAFSWGALHHLPDFWKFVALTNVREAIGSGKYLLLEDVVWCFTPHEYESALESLIDSHHKSFGEEVANDLRQNIKEEFVTFDFVLDELISRAGFFVENKHVSDDSCFATYLLLSK